MNNLRIEEASNGVILRGNIGPNNEYRSELFLFGPDFETELNARLDQIELDAKANVTTQIINLKDQAEKYNSTETTN